MSKSEFDEFEKERLRRGVEIEELRNGIDFGIKSFDRRIKALEAKIESMRKEESRE